MEGGGGAALGGGVPQGPRPRKRPLPDAPPPEAAAAPPAAIGADGQAASSSSSAPAPGPAAPAAAGTAWAAGARAAAPAAAPAGAEPRPSKRRRLGQASVLCMRELFRAVVKDGDITEADRLALQNVALLLAQVDGKTWVNFADTQGSLQDFTPQQLKFLRPFLEKVAKELKETQTDLSSLDNGKEVIDVLQLADVPWADGITARELLGCCGPDQDLLMASPLLDRVVRRLPSRYMLGSRVRELINYYYLKRHTCAEDGPRAAEGAAAGEPGRCRGCCSAAARCAAAAAGAFRPCLRRGRRAVGAAFAAATMAVGSVVVWLALVAVAAARAAARAAAAAARALAPRGAGAAPAGEEPFWPAVRFIVAALLHGQTKEVFKFLVMVARLRVFVCLGSCNRFFGVILYPLVFVVEKVLKLNRGNRLLGCVCDAGDDVSWLSWAPVRASDGLVWLLKLARHIPLVEFVTEPFVEAVDLMHPFLKFVFDLTFSMGIAQGLAMVVDIADEQAQQKLVFMSMGVSRRMREGPREAPAVPDAFPGPAAGAPAAGAPFAAAAAAGAAAGAAGGGAHLAAGGGGLQDAPPDAGAGAVPAWAEDGSWSLFD